MQILLSLFVFLEADKTKNIINIIKQSQNDLLVKASEANLAVHSSENINRAFNALFNSIQQYENFNEIQTKKIQKKRIKGKYVMLHTFLFALNQYVYDLIAVPVKIEKTTHLFNASSVDIKKRKTVDPDSFFEQHKKPITIVQYIGLSLLISGLLYRFIKNDKKGVFSFL
jgi:hypothetical protein